MASQAVSFYSEGTSRSGDLFLPAGLASGEHRAGIVLCHGIPVYGASSSLSDSGFRPTEGVKLPDAEPSI
jgi:hypothetical protein